MLVPDLKSWSPSAQSVANSGAGPLTTQNPLYMNFEGLVSSGTGEGREKSVIEPDI